MKYRAFLILIAMTLFVGYGCPVRGRVLMVGDSNTVLSAETLVGYLWSGSGNGTWVTPPPSYLLSFAAVSGSGFKDAQPADPNAPAWVPTLDAIDAAQEFDAVVLALGVNDATTGNCTAGLDGKIDDVIDELPANIPIVLVDAPYVPSSNYSNTCLVNVNLALQAATSRYSPRIRYVNINAALSNAGLSYPNGWFSDGVHYTIAAQYVLSEQIRVALEEVL